MYEKYSKDLEILAFPCNNFGSQEPGTNAEILEFAKNKGAKYPILGKLECENGDNTAPFYQFLRASIPNGVFGQGLKWNFSKFLCDRNGVPVKRYAPTSSPLTIVGDIEDLIKKYVTLKSNTSPNSQHGTYFSCLYIFFYFFRDVPDL